ncbi:MAG: aldehyde dehydrogenase family protein, partial [Nitrospirae bacterium]|nr:aldehyde dehydrogenase family protein [Fimbriimonadaceae bacterium]
YLAENLLGSRTNVVEALETFRGTMEPEAEFDLAIQRLYEFAAWADKFEGRVHEVPGRVLCYSRREPLGTLGVLCSDEHPLLGLVGPSAAALAMGNAVVALASEARPLAAVALYRVLEASDVPGGVWNILTGQHGEMVPTLADHMDLDGFWCFEPRWRAEVERRSAANLKRTWAASDADFQAEDALRQATQIKNVWVPVGYRLGAASQGCSKRAATSDHGRISLLPGNCRPRKPSCSKRSPSCSTPVLIAALKLPAREVAGLECFICIAALISL